MPRIRAVLFDLWGTLMFDDPDIGERRRLLRTRMAHEALTQLGFGYDPADIEAGFIAAGLEHARLHEQGRDLSARGRTVLYLTQVDPALPDRLGDDGWRRMDDAVLTQMVTHGPSLMPGAVEALKDVKALGLPAGLISNTGITPGFVLRPIMQRLGLLADIDVTVFSDEVEMAKPSPAIFEHALDELGLEPDEAAFVGDQPLLDVFGARRAGVWTVQIGDLERDGIEPHARIAALDELLPALRSLGLIGQRVTETG